MKKKGLKKAKVFIDGASRGNPGPASIGAVFQNPEGEAVGTLSLRIGQTTNNVAEYTALVFALQEALILRLEELEVFTDSELLARQFSGQYKIKDAALQSLSLQVKHLCRGLKKISVTHIPREKNTLADREANKALDQFFLQAG